MIRCARDWRGTNTGKEESRTVLLGMKQRLGIVCNGIACGEPGHVLDEPTNGSDPIGIKGIES